MEEVVAENWARLFADLPHPVCVAEPNGAFLHVNAAWTPILGWEKEELLARPYLDFVHPDDVAATLDEARALAGDGRPTRSFRNRYRKKDGGFVWLDWTASCSDGRVYAAARDVTEEITAAREREGRIRQLEMAEGLARVGTWSVDLVRNTVRWSPEIYRIHGLDPETHTPDLLSGITSFHPEDQAAVARCVTRAVEETEPFRFKHRLVRPSGEERIVESYGHPEVDEEGNVHAIVGVFADITESERSRKALVEQARRAREQALRLNELVRLSRTSFASSEDATRAYLQAAVSRTSLRHGAYIEDLEELRPWVREGLPMEHHLSSPLRAVAFDRSSSAGVIAPELAYIAAPVMVRGAVRGVFVVYGPRSDEPEDYDREFVELLSTSIGYRLQVREESQAFLRQKRFFESMFTQAPESIIVSDAATRRVMFANPKAVALFGYPESELTQTTTRMLYSSEEGFRRLGVELQAAATRGGRVATELPMRRADGTEFDAEISATVVQGEIGESLAFISHIRDITDRNRIQRMHEEFISVASHELRTPLTSLIGSIGLLSYQRELLPEPSRELLDLSIRSGKRLQDLINDLLDLQKLEGARLTVDAKHLDLSGLVKETVTLLQPYGDSCGVRYVVEAEPSDCFGDESRLRQVVTNLLSNAAKFSPQGSTVDVRVRGHTSCAVCEVADRGSGVPSAFRDRIFQKFAQADGTHTRPRGGTGLGLAIAKALVEQMGGTIGFRDRDGGGSVFFFEIPGVEGSRRRASA